MKCFATIMVIIFSALLVMQCTDGTNGCVENNKKTTLSSHEHNQDKDDMCSPFCQCACCSISIATLHFVFSTFDTYSITPPTRKAAFNNVYVVSNYLGSIWQPPKVIT